MSRKITNLTSWPNANLRELVRFATPPGLTNFDLTIRQGKAEWIGGRAWKWGKRTLITLNKPDASYPSLHNHEQEWVELREGRKIQHKTTGGYLRELFLTREEEVLAVIAHELRHLWNYEHPNGRRVWGSRGVGSERDADAYAIRVTRKWRRMKNGVL